MIKDALPAFRQFLRDDTAIAAMVVTGSTVRIYPVKLPQGMIQTSIVYRVTPGQPGDYHTEGPSGLVTRRVQINAWAKTVNDAFHLSNLIKFRVDGYRGTMQTNASPPQIIRVQGVFLALERDDYASDIAMYTMQRDYSMAYEER